MRWLVVVWFATGSGCDLLFELKDPQSPDAAIGEDANTCTADTQVDSQNCGTCGRDCLGGDCIAGVCQPVALATGLGQPLHIAQSDTHVYWVNVTDNNVQRVLKTGTAQDIETMIGAQIGPIDIAVDDVHFYWTTNTKVFRCSLDGCGGEAAEVGGCSAVTDLAIGSSSANFTCGTAQVSRSSKTGVGGTTTVVGDAADVQQIVIAGDDVYWAEKGADRIRRAPADGGAAPMIFLPDAEAVEALAVDADSVYYAGFEVPELHAAGRQTGISRLLADAQPNIEAIAVHEGVVYYVGGTDTGYLRSCVAAGCNNQPTEIATGIDHPADVVVDDRFYFYSTSPGTGGTLMRLVR